MSQVEYAAIAALRDENADLRARAEAAETKNAALDALFAGGPDTTCRTTWRDHKSVFGTRLSEREECVEVPMEDLRAALGDSPAQVGEESGGDAERDALQSKPGYCGRSLKQDEVSSARYESGIGHTWGLICTRTDGHEGEHIASDSVRILARWSGDAEPGGER
jgi:hypothetical protein